MTNHKIYLVENGKNPKSLLQKMDIIYSTIAPQAYKPWEILSNGLHMIDG